jgi:tetratricopeptide (TPR) repeat protein
MSKKFRTRYTAKSLASAMTFVVASLAILLALSASGSFAAPNSQTTKDSAAKNLGKKSLPSTKISSTKRSSAKNLAIKNSAIGSPTKPDSSPYTVDLQDASLQKIPLTSRVLMVNILEKHYSRSAIENIIASQNGLLSVNPNEVGALIVRGFAQWKLDRYRGAQVDLEKVLKVYPQITEVNFYRVLGECYLQRDDHTKALDCFSKMIQTKPRFVIGYLRRCQTYIEIKEYAKALPDANKVVELAKHEIWSLELRALVNRLNGRYTEAIADCTEGIDQAPNVASLYDERSKSYAKLGKKELAERDKKVWNQFSRETLLDTLGE